MGEIEVALWTAQDVMAALWSHLAHVANADFGLVGSAGSYSSLNSLTLTYADVC